MREKSFPAVRAVVVRIAVFYVGFVLLLAILLPYSAYSGNESPFVTVFSKLGVLWIGSAMNIVVITAAFSSCNFGLYSTGLILNSLAAAGEAPKFTARLSKHHVPYGGIGLTEVVYFFGVVLCMIVSSSAFEIAVETASVGIVWTWITIFACQIALRRRIDRGEAEKTPFAMPWYLYSTIFGIASLVLIVVIVVFDSFNRSVLLCSMAYVAIVLICWPFIKRNNAAHFEYQHAQEITFGDDKSHEQNFDNDN